MATAHGHLRLPTTRFLVARSCNSSHASTRCNMANRTSRKIHSGSVVSSPYVQRPLRVLYLSCSVAGYIFEGDKLADYIIRVKKRGGDYLISPAIG